MPQSLKKTWNEINLLYLQEIEKKFVFAKQKYYKAGPKVLKILARRLQKERADITVSEIKDPGSGAMLSKQEDLLEKYYRNFENGVNGVLRISLVLLQLALVNGNEMILILVITVFYRR